MVTAKQFADEARKGKYIGTPYEKLDCQALVERVLIDCGIKYNWRGSNHMWREALTEKRPITNVDEIPMGAWLFTVKNDGGEKKRGYNDNEGNAKHVGIYLGMGDVVHSTTGGVQYDSIYSERWTHWGKCKFLEYETPAEQAEPSLIDLLKLLESKTLKEIWDAIKKAGWV